MTTALRLEGELGNVGDAIEAFVCECEAVINQMDPELDYRRSDLQGFVRAAWPCEGEPVDAAAEFAAEVRKQNA